MQHSHKTSLYDEASVQSALLLMEALFWMPPTELILCFVNTLVILRISLTERKGGKQYF